MSEEISFVEVVMYSYKPGDKEYQYFFENEIDCFDIAWEDATEIIPEVIKAREENEKRAEAAKSNNQRVYTTLSLGGEPNLLITKPLTGFVFHCFGQGFEYYASGIDFEFREIGAKEVFGNDLDELKKLGQSIIEDKRGQLKKADGKIVRFITIWSYSSWQDYYGEFDNEWWLIGLVKPEIMKDYLDTLEA